MREVLILHLVSKLYNSRDPPRHKYTDYNNVEDEVEKRVISVREKLKVIEQLKTKDHEYMSFFVCRNPIEKLLSAFDMKREQFALTKSRGIFLSMEEFFSWPQVLSLWSSNWRLVFRFKFSA